MIEWIAAFFLVAGSVFMLVAAIGVVKLQDVYMRMHAITKAASLGAILMLVAVFLIYQHWLVLVEALMVVLFVIFTAPIASHMIAKAAHITKMPKGKGYVVDELDGKEADTSSQ